MSETPNNGSGDGNQGEQPQGGQPKGGRPNGNQPQGSQATGGQPQGGQHQGQPPQGGQPQQGQPQGQPAQGQAQRAPVNAGPSVGDIFSRDDTLDQIKLGVVMYALVGFGLGLGLFGIGAAFSNPSGFGAVVQAAGVLAGGFVLPVGVSVVLAAIIGMQQDDELSDVDDTLVFATSGVTSFAGSLVTYILAIILLGLGAGSISFNNMIIPMITTALGAAIVSIAAIWTERNLLSPSAAPPQGRQQY